MNRKEGIVVGVLLIITFTASAFAAPAIQNIMILNDPLNVRIVGAPSLQTASVEIEVLSVVPGTLPPNTGALVFFGAPTSRIDFFSGFSFAPGKGFAEVTAVVVTILFQEGSVNSGDMFSVQLNQGPSDNVPTISGGAQGSKSVVIVLQGQDLRTGSNLMKISVANDTPGEFNSYYYLYQVRLTVEYTFMA